MHEAIEREHACADCNSLQQITHMLSSFGERLRFSSGFRCSKCGSAVEFDGDALPDELRDAFYERHGRWTLRLVKLGVDRARALSALRALGFSVQQLTKLPLVIAEGTRVELSIPQQRLAATCELELVRAV